MNTKDSVANWCQVTTKTGKLSVSLELDRCFEGEVYADEMDFDETQEFRDDQRSTCSSFYLLI